MKSFTYNSVYTPEFTMLLQDNESALLLGSEMNAQFSDWERERAFLGQSITKPGTILDFGSANGLLLRSLQEWTGLRDQLIPYGVDTNSDHITNAKQLFPKHPGHFYASDRFLQTPIEERPRELQGPFDYVYWNVWDNLSVAEGSDEYFKGYFTRLLEITKNNGTLIMGFYQQNETDSQKKIEHIKSLLDTAAFQQSGIKNTKIFKNPQGSQMAMVIHKRSQ